MKTVLCLLLAFAAALADELPYDDSADGNLEDQLSAIDILKLTPAIATVNEHDSSKSGGAVVGPRSGLGIIQGERTIHGLFPYHVAVLVEAKTLCSGALISRRAVLTTAHCVNGSKSIIVCAGMNSLFGITDTPCARDLNITIHPQYNATTMENDIAILRVHKNDSFVPNTWIKKVSVSNATDNTFTDNRARTSGWATRGGLKEYLRYDDFTVISNTECEKAYGPIVTDNTLCAVPQPDRTACMLDGGSPLVDLESGHLIGLATFTSSAGCTSPLPAAYVRVSSYSSFIWKSLSSLQDD